LGAHVVLLQRGRRSQGRLAVPALIYEDRVRWHQGELLLEGTRRGAIFTGVLPPFAGWSLHAV